MTPEFHLERYLTIIRKTTETLLNIGRSLDAADARTWRDGGTGWTALEVLGHLRDFDAIFLGRARSLLEQDNPTFCAWDHDQMAIDHAYNEQPLAEVLAALAASRAEMIAFFEGLTAQQLECAGTHPEMGAWTMMRSVAQVAAHDANHIEQITRILLERRTN